MENPGERLVGDYLRYIGECDFTDFNVYTKLAQGEIDVIGVNHAEKKAYICEVVTHLPTGIQYVKNKRPDTDVRLIKKFIKDINYGERAFPGYNVIYMLWSPVVRQSNGKAKYNQFDHLERVCEEIFAKKGIKIELVTNEKYMAAIGELRAFANTETKELKSPVMRFLQIEEWCKKNCASIEKKAAKKAAAAQASALQNCLHRGPGGQPPA
jgi:hypothetical protein